MGKMTQKLEDIKRLIGKLQQQQPESIQNFLGFMTSVEKEGALSTKQKELINVGLAVAAQCEWCIALHVKGAIDAGASKEEILEAAMQAVLMHGGPALMYMTPVEEALEEFSHE
ncbi:carboxymuconolactone decarboxylase family protein [Nitratiruptor tergarcus]|uniref:Alkylhydroperoxidase AhpD family core domain-containing protein n=1 Tax=Nitratiruptor tergarcus DSM 16512 TaxID=1069081 RepID=A0A1W1WU03_9BACT|nr:carboxymuconolactone decarboxylase family protein [Nitratiruptor tergarcus]SMC09682.1 alkylhydroperoxidase AhpD family core domain-containing protein [Nitratiruptor tergarcus DSM 16512]